MKTLLLILLPVAIFAQSGDAVFELKRGEMTWDSSYVYSLPWKEGKSYLVVQGYNSKMSHRNEYALDFKMKRGTQVCAMREGIVVETKEDSNRGGVKKKYYADANYIMIRHSDRTYGWYFHLKKNGVLVNRGDSVKAGQVIGLSGNSGYSAFPHLHVEVVIADGGRYKQIPIRFRSKKGIRYLRPARFYRQGKTSR